MARRVVIRSRHLNTALAQLEELVAANYKAIIKDHIEDLESMAESIVEDALDLVPVDTGELKSSIHARVSRSPRYPGIIVQASAKDKGFDYALIQEENEEFSHLVGQAHYLSEPFYYWVDEWMSEWTGKGVAEPHASGRSYVKGEKV